MERKVVFYGRGFTANPKNSWILLREDANLSQLWDEAKCLKFVFAQFGLLSFYWA